MGKVYDERRRLGAVAKQPAKAQTWPVQKPANRNVLTARYFAPLLLILSFTTPTYAQDFLREELRIPFEAAGAKGLQALLIRPRAEGRYPLAIINHGSPRDRNERAKMRPTSLTRQAEEFAK